MFIDIILALGISTAVSLLAMGLYHLKYKSGLFTRIRNNVGCVAFVITLGIFLFGIFGFNIWTVIIVPLISLTILYVVIRNAIAKLLETSAE
jgi:hypothetical protein